MRDALTFVELALRFTYVDQARVLVLYVLSHGPRQQIGSASLSLLCQLIGLRQCLAA
jgi:hypothetical protein